MATVKIPGFEADTVYGMALSTDPPEGQLRSDAATARIRTLVAAAAPALSADGAAFVLFSGRGTECLASVGAATTIVWSPELTAAALGSRLLLVERSEQNHAFSASLFDSDIRFFASLHIGSDEVPLGLLAVCSHDPRSLSGAQEYVLATFAAQIADQFELEELRKFRATSQLKNGSRERLRLLESVVINANDAVLITEAEPVDLPGPRIVFANRAFTRTTGYELREILGMTPRILQGPETGDSARVRIRAALRAWEPIEVELLNYHKDQTPFWVELSIVPVADESGYFTHWVSVQRDVTERKAAEELATRARVSEAANAALEYRAFHDELTGLRNRAYLTDLVQSRLDRLHDGDGHRFAVLFFDLDRFKVVNDGLGHRVGDLMLIEFARKIESCIRPKDTLARMGGDEFLCLIEAEDMQDVVTITERILVSLRTPIRLANREIFASTSIGIAHVDERYESGADVIRDADTAMYRAKNNGGMRFELFHETMHERALATLRSQMDLRAAIDRTEFKLYYQPLVNINDGRAYGFEALVRWQHPERGLIGPAEFIPVAEETGLIVTIGTRILREACRQMHAWHVSSPELAKLALSVNVSSRQLSDPNFMNELEAALSDSGMDGRTLQLELTESIILEQAESVRNLLERIRSLGVRIALDDFGTGYSSLSYLERFPIDTLKIDQSFVRRLLTEPTTSEIVRLIVGLGRALDMNVVAEGVENVEQWDALRKFGCGSAQGYLFSRPVSEREAPALLGRQLAKPLPSRSSPLF